MGAVDVITAKPATIPKTAVAIFRLGVIRSPTGGEGGVPGEGATDVPVGEVVPMLPAPPELPPRPPISGLLSVDGPPVSRLLSLEESDRAGLFGDPPGAVWALLSIEIEIPILAVFVLGSTESDGPVPSDWEPLP